MGPGFELRFIKPLIAGRLMREIWVGALVRDDIGGPFVAAHGRLDVANAPTWHLAVNSRVADILDRAQRKVGNVLGFGFPRRLQQIGQWCSTSQT